MKSERTFLIGLVASVVIIIVLVLLVIFSGSPDGSSNRNEQSPIAVVSEDNKENGATESLPGQSTSSFSNIPTAAPSTPGQISETTQQPPQNPVEVVLDPASEALRAYGNSVATIAVKDREASQADADVFEAVILDQKDAESTAKLRDISEYYAGVSGQLNALNTPSAVASVHAALVENYAAIGVQFAAISSAAGTNSFNDMLETYSEVADQNIQVLTDLVFFFRDNNVKFLPEDPGFIFTLPS